MPCRNLQYTRTINTRGMSKFINPFTDVGFKRIFGQEINKDLLIDFLNSLFAGEKNIKDIRFLDKELVPGFQGDRGVIYDVYCTNEDGEQFIVEMQREYQAHFKERAVYYLSQAIARQGEKGVGWDYKVKAVYGIFFMDFRLKERATGRLRTDVVLADRDTHEVFSDKLRFVFLELPSFNKEEDECDNDFERWIYVLKNMETLQRMPFKARKSVFEKLEQIVDIAAMSKEDRIKYDESIKVYRDSQAVMAYREEQGWIKGREEGRKEGRKEGREEGRKEGREEGRKEGREEGRKEGREKGKEEERIKIAKSMKAEGLSDDAIARITGMSVEDIAML